MGHHGKERTGARGRDFAGRVGCMTIDTFCFCVDRFSGIFWKLYGNVWVALRDCGGRRFLRVLLISLL
jgi:hypothetical protein